jgi:hypothetical protein
MRTQNLKAISLGLLLTPHALELSIKEVALTLFNVLS